MLVITNAEAGGAEIGQVEAAAAELGPDTELASCSAPGDFEASLEHGHDTVVVAGGDGSLHALANALYRRGELGERTVGLIPMGTGNDFARTLGLPLDPCEAAALLRKGTVRPLDLIADDTDEITVNAVHVGVGADSARVAARYKRLLGPASYPVGGFIAGLRERGYRLRVAADGEVVHDTAHRVVMVGLANARYIGGGAALLGPDARPNDGAINLVVSSPRSLTERVVYAFRLHRGTHPLEFDVQYRRAQTVTVTGEPCAASADGELIEAAIPRTWRVLPGAWRFLVPPEHPDAAR